LYLRYWELDPKAEHHAYTISKLVLELGWDIKRQKVNYELAQMFFEDLIRMSKPRWIPIAHYRLGFIHFYNKKYRKSISQLESALQSLSPNIARHPHPHEMLNDLQKMKAQVQLAIALSKYSMGSALKAKQMYEKLGNPDDVDIEFVMKLEKEILLEEHPLTRV
jgi:tetratricopeptide (TPR) repeat protein